MTVQQEAERAALRALNVTGSDSPRVRAFAALFVEQTTAAVAEGYLEALHDAVLEEDEEPTTHDVRTAEYLASEKARAALEVVARIHAMTDAQVATAVANGRQGLLRLLRGHR